MPAACSTQAVAVAAVPVGRPALARLAAMAAETVGITAVVAAAVLTPDRLRMASPEPRQAAETVVSERQARPVVLAAARPQRVRPARMDRAVVVAAAGRVPITIGSVALVVLVSNEPR